MQDVGFFVPLIVTGHEGIFGKGLVALAVDRIHLGVNGYLAVGVATVFEHGVVACAWGNGIRGVVITLTAYFGVAGNVHVVRCFIIEDAFSGAVGLVVLAGQAADPVLTGIAGKEAVGFVGVQQ